MQSRRQTKAVLSGAQIEIMQVVWQRGEATVANVCQELAGTRKLARNTIQTVLTRLERKGWLRHRQEGNTFFYSATMDRSGTLRELVNRLVETAFDGSAEGLVMTLMDGRGLTSDEADRIEAMIAKARVREKQEG